MSNEEHTETKPTAHDQQALERVKRARVKADDRTILSFVRHVGADLILRSTLRDIRAVANAF
jgi:hypothetical protein